MPVDLPAGLPSVFGIFTYSMQFPLSRVNQLVNNTTTSPSRFQMRQMGFAATRVEQSACFAAYGSANTSNSVLNFCIMTIF